MTLAPWLLVAATAVGIDVGWQPLADGGMEYIIQLEPSTLDLLAGGDEVTSDVLPALRTARRYRVTVGEGPVPRSGLGEDRPAGRLADSTPPPEGIGWRPARQGGFELLVQLTDDQLKSLRSGSELSGDIPAVLDEVRSYRFNTGTGAVPRAGAEVASARPAKTDRYKDIPPAVAAGLPRSGAGKVAAELPPRSIPEADAATHDLEGDRLDGGPNLLRLDQFAARDAIDGNDPHAPEAETPPRLFPGEGPPPTAETAAGHLVGYQRDLETGDDVGTSGGVLNLAGDEGPSSTEPGTIEEDAIDDATGERPWRTLWLVALALFVSLAINVYLVWIAWNLRQRYAQMQSEVTFHRITSDTNSRSRIPQNGSLDDREWLPASSDDFDALIPPVDS